MSLLIRNGEIVTADARFKGDIWCEDETITAIGPNLPAPKDAEILDATGRYVFPGFIDPHVHIYLPFMGTFAKDNYETASRAALVGGTTTLIEMVCPSRTDDPLEAYELWKSQAAGKSACDYAFHFGVTRFDDRTPRSAQADPHDGTALWKIFPAYEGGVRHRRYGSFTERWSWRREMARDRDVAYLRERGDGRAALRSKATQPRSKTGPEWHEPSRPTTVEAEGVHHLATFAELTGAHVYVVHTSCADALAASVPGLERAASACGSRR